MNEKLTAREWALLKILQLITKIIGRGVDGYYDHELSYIYSKLKEEENAST